MDEKRFSKVAIECSVVEITDRMKTVGRVVDLHSGFHNVGVLTESGALFELDPRKYEVQLPTLGMAEARVVDSSLSWKHSVWLVEDPPAHDTTPETST